MPSQSLPRCALIKIIFRILFDGYPVNRRRKMSNMAALGYRYCWRSLMHLRRSIYSTTILGEANKPALTEERHVEVKTVDQTVSISDHVIIIIYSLGSLGFKICVVSHKNKREDMYAYSSRPRMQCSPVPITLISGRLSLRMKKDGKTH